MRTEKEEDEEEEKGGERRGEEKYFKILTCHIRISLLSSLE
jgi:hypothetical protein